MPQHRKNPVRVLQSPLTGHIYAVTAYSIDEDGSGLTARTKHDVTDDVRLLIREAVEAEQVEWPCLCDRALVNSHGCICGSATRQEFLAREG